MSKHLKDPKNILDPRGLKGFVALFYVSVQALVTY